MMTGCLDIPESLIFHKLTDSVKAADILRGVNAAVLHLPITQQGLNIQIRIVYMH